MKKLFESNQRFVVSFTTIPSRIKYTKLVIDSLLEQTRIPDMIYLNIPYVSLKGEKYFIPRFLKSYSKKQLTILRCEDYGPITKLIPVLEIERDSETIIMIIDDDNSLHKNTISIFERNMKKFNSALSMSGYNFGNSPFILEYLENEGENIKVDWLQGTHGIVFKRKFINLDILTCFKTAPECLLHQDDVKIGGYLAKKKIDRIVLNYDPHKYFIRIEDSYISDALSRKYFGIEFALNMFFSAEYFRDINLFNLSYNYKKSMLFSSYILNIIFLVIFYFYGFRLEFVFIYIFLQKKVISVSFRNFISN
jgi:hypothetical protein